MKSVYGRQFILPYMSRLVTLLANIYFFQMRYEDQEGPRRANIRRISMSPKLLLLLPRNVVEKEAKSSLLRKIRPNLLHHLMRMPMLLYDASAATWKRMRKMIES